ncbi:four-carbon acid sugar kinase family protein [Opitutus terrae]|uniref:Four-carbon acid sugar kinase N-terminal domain-containing protein n=1 Tax=Opitutus terrae (strain DSM 11246 / JCM 15787 / PB90-1) TaxID=452637 RepID=B1ZNR4_OPITP|nr:four-carbon acid sugar kinase family protein [Opitutus terrae]ACB75434.1 conserved hypothetical protein [Opitutus terrae PB90-1]
MIVVLADDISGAAELAGAALRRGFSAEVQTSFQPDTEAEVVCVDTDSRSLAPQAAEAVVAAIARQVAAARPDWVYKKCDSVLRGHVRRETQAVMAALNRRRAVLVPANPSRGRVVRNGEYFVGEQPLDQTEFARDPEHPRTTARVAELLGGELTGVVVPNTETPGDVDAHAFGLDETTLPVGGVDFFEALLRRRGAARAAVSAGSAASAGNGSVLVVCGSAAAWSVRRAEARARGVAVFPQPHDVAAICAAWRAARTALIGIGDGPATSGRSPGELVSALAGTVVEVVRRIETDRLLLEGGATAAAVVRALGWTRLRACEVAASGVGVFTPAGTVRPRVAIKPGSYSWPVEIWPGR